MSISHLIDIQELKDELARVQADAEELRAELRKKSCCKGCPDCVGIGMGEELRVLRAALVVCVEALEEISEGVGCGARYGPGCDTHCKDLARPALTQARACLEGEKK